ncbi:hypothetical protein QA596_11410 [Balneolales bacterium ANBcel1]|nr:hypothetical protein [Balneolales bacterium ANBcel1]
MKKMNGRRERLWQGAITRGTMAVLIFLMAAPVLLLADSGERKALELTIYPRFAWVHDSREVQLPAGESRVVLDQLARQMDTGSVHLVVDGEITELRIDSEFHGWDSLFRELTGRHIRMISETDQLIEGELVDFSQGRLILKLDSGKYTLLQNPYQYRLEFDSMPPVKSEGARIHAGISVGKAGTYALDLYYIANNLSWQADYSLVLDHESRKASLEGRATIRNLTGTDFSGAGLRLVAGEVSVTPRHAYDYFGAPHGREMMRADAAGTAPEPLADYYVYELDGKRDLREQETLQIPLITAFDIAFEKEYRHTARPFSSGFRDARSVSVTYQFSNEGAKGLGNPMPAGEVRVYETGEAGTGRRLELLGQDRISGKTAGERVRVTTGEAFDIAVTEQVSARDQIAGRTQEEQRQITVSNASGDDVVVMVEVPLHGVRRIMKESMEPEEQSADRRVYAVAVPAGGEQSLEITVRQE